MRRLCLEAGIAPRFRFAGRDGKLFVYRVWILRRGKSDRCKRSTTVLMPAMAPGSWPDSVRCYIDGNSWMWKYAPGILRAALGLLQIQARKPRQ